MDGSSYQNPYRRAHVDSPLSPDTPQSATYKANVNRTKTRKWVEAKTQNYDGDDWGGDDFEDDPPVPAVPPLRPSGSRQASYASNRLPSGPPIPSQQQQQQLQQPSQQSPYYQQLPAEKPREAGPPPVLHIQTQDAQLPSAPPPEVEIPAAEQSIAQSPSASGNLDHHRSLEARAPPQVDAQDKQSVAGDGQSTHADEKPLPFVPLSDVHQRSDQDTARSRSPTPPMEETLHRPSEPIVASHSNELNSTAPGASMGQQTFKQSLSSAPPSSGSPQAEVRPNQEPASDDRGGVHGSSDPAVQPLPLHQQTQPQATGTTEPVVQPDSQAVHSPYQFADYPDADQIEETKRFSTSPQLPNLARMSMFGDDLFSGSNRFSVSSPTVPPLPEEAYSPSPPVSATPSQPTVLSPRDAAPNVEIPKSPDAPQQEESKIVDTMTENKPDAGPEPAPSTLDNDSELEPPRPSRPSLPGEWVSDSVQPSDLAASDPAPPDTKDHTEDQAPTEHSLLQGGALSTGVAGSAVANSTLSEPHEQSHQALDVDATGSASQQTRQLETARDDFAAPEVLRRENTLSTVASPSPIKESDKLREEIIRTLSPVRPTEGPSNSTVTDEPARDAAHPVRESTYLHGVYDDYWSASDDKTALDAGSSSLAPKPYTSPDDTDLPHVQPLSPRSPMRDPSLERQPSPAASQPRRFSWEADSGADPSTTDKPTSVVTEPPSVAVASPTGPPESDDETPGPVEKDEPLRVSDGLPSRIADSARIDAPENSGQISHQVSQVSTLPRDEQSNITAPQPPSPISAVSEPSSAEPKTLTHPQEKTLGTPPAAPTASVNVSEEQSTLPAAEEAPNAAAKAPSPQPEQQQGGLPRPDAQQPDKILSFREILEMPNATDRIAKYDETRQQFAHMDSGLKDWLVHLQSQQPEHSQVSSSYQALLQSDAQFGGTFGGPGQTPSSPSGPQPAAQQPYYQQYLNASSPTTSSAPGRNPLGSFSGGAGSDFKHSSGQVGAKSKEFLLAAGKAGKGLLSKGKDKLRRDKNEETSPSRSPSSSQAQAQAQAQAHQSSPAKNDRRMSWALSLGGRTGHRDGPQPPQGHQHQRSVSEAAPQIPQPSRLSPFESSSPWAPPPDSKNSKNATHQRSGSQADELVSPVSDTHSMLGRDDALATGGLSAPPAASASQSTQGSAAGVTASPVTAAAPDHKSDEWVMVEKQPPPQVARKDSVMQSFQAQAQSSRRNTQAESSSKAESPTRKSSFIGLPPIRRGSTFGLNYARRAKERFSLDEDELDDPIVTRSGQPGPSESTDPTSSLQQDEGRSRRGSGTLVSADTMVNSHARELGHDGLPEGTLGGASTLGPRTSFDSGEVDVGEDPEKKPIPPPIDPAPRQREAPPQALDARGRRPSGMGPMLQEGNPVQHVPPEGWKLEQSHLSEPLLQTSRSRQFLSNRQPAPTEQQQDAAQAVPPQSGISAAPQRGPHEHPRGDSQAAPPPIQQITTQPDVARNTPSQAGLPQAGPHQVGHAGGPTPGPPSRVSTQMPPRQKFSETPPSSARRYPGLFSGVAGHPRQLQGPPGPPGPQGLRGPHGPPGGPRGSLDLPSGIYQQPLSRDEVMIQRTQSGEFQLPGMGPPEEDSRGRQKRNSGFFKDIGDRFRAASRERRNSTADQRPSIPPSNLHVQQHVGVPQPDDISVVSSAATEELQEKKKRRRSSFFMKLGGSKDSEDKSTEGPNFRGDGHADSDLSAPPRQFNQSNRRRSFFGTSLGGSSSALPTLSRTSTMSNGHDREGSLHSQNTPKKRLSTFAGKLFSRPSNQQEEVLKPGTSQSMTPSIQSRHSTLASTQPVVPSPLANHNRERSNTAGSGLGLTATPTNISQVSAEEEDRSRRASAGRRLTSLFNRSSSKNRESKIQNQRLPRQQQDPTDQFEPPFQQAPRQGLMNQPQGHSGQLDPGQQFPQSEDRRQMGPPRQSQQFSAPSNAPLGVMQKTPQPGLLQTSQISSQADQAISPVGPPPGFTYEPLPQQTQEPQRRQVQAHLPDQSQRLSLGAGQAQQQAPQQQLGQNPPPFRTQGPPVHPVASVSPPNRTQPVFPDLQKPANQQITVGPSSPEPLDQPKRSPLAPEQGAEGRQSSPDAVVAQPQQTQPTRQEPQGPVQGFAPANSQQAPLQPPPRSHLRDQELQDGIQTGRDASTKPYAVSPDSSPEMTTSTARVESQASRQVEGRHPPSDRVPSGSVPGTAGALLAAGPGQQSIRGHESQDPASSAPLARHTQHPSIRKPIAAGHLTVTHQEGSVSQLPPVNQPEMRTTQLPAAPSPNPSDRSSVTAGQADPRMSQVSAMSPPQQQQQQQGHAAWDQGPPQRLPAGQQNAGVPQGQLPGRQGFSVPQGSAGSQALPGPQVLAGPRGRPDSKGAAGSQGMPGASGQQSPQQFLTLQNTASAPTPSPQSQQQPNSMRKFLSGLKATDQTSQQGQIPQAPPQQQQQQVPEKKKEKSSKSLFGAFKRSSKQPEMQTQQAPPPPQINGHVASAQAQPGRPMQMMGSSGQFQSQQPGMQGQMPPHLQQQQQQQQMMMIMQGRPEQAMQPYGMQQGQHQQPLPGQNMQYGQGMRQQPQSMSQGTLHPQGQPQSQQFAQHQQHRPGETPSSQPDQTAQVLTPPLNATALQQVEQVQRGSPPYLQYQQQRVSPANVPVPGQNRPSPPLKQPSSGSIGQGPYQLQQRPSFGPEQGPSQQQQPFGPAQMPPQVQQRPSFGSGQEHLIQGPPRQSFGPGHGPIPPQQLQQRGSFGPGNNLPPHLMQHPSFGPGQPPGPMPQQSPPQFSDPGPAQQYQQGVGHPQMQQLSPPQRTADEPFVEQQYEPVPIPRGYAAVHGEGSVDQSPYDIGRYVSPSLGSQAQFQHHQPLATQHAVQSNLGHLHGAPKQYQQQPEQHRQQQPQQHQWGPPNHLGIQQPQSQPDQPYQQGHIVQSAAESHVVYGTSPQSNAQVAGPPTSVTPHTSTQTPPQPSGSAKKSPEPTTPAQRNLPVTVPGGSPHDNDDIYNATPQRRPLERRRTGESQVSISSMEEAARKANGAAKKAKVNRVNSTRAELEDTEDERKRSIRLEAQEEKILYDPLEDGPSAGKKKGDNEPDAPQMSATSYPGMEWNPYASGHYEDWND